MILRDLLRLAEREKLSPAPGFWREDVSWIVVIDQDGKVLRVDPPESVEIQAKSAKGKAKLVEGSRFRWVPATDKNNPGATPDSLIAKAERLFGWIEGGKVNPKSLNKAQECRSKFRALLNEITDRSQNDVGLCAWQKSLDLIAKDPQDILAVWPAFDLRKPVEYRCTATEKIFSLPQILSDLIAFRLEGDNCLIVQRPAVAQAWAEREKEMSFARNQVRCLVSGGLRQEIDKHPQVLLFPGSWISLVSVSDEHKAFQHAGQEGLSNAPIGTEEARSVAIALARLVANGDFIPPGQSKALPQRHLRLPGELLVLYWCEAESEKDPIDDPWFAGCIDPDAVDPASIRACYERPWRDTGQMLVDLDAPFHALILSPNNKRVVLRAAHTRPVGQVAASVKRWLDDLEIVKRFEHDRSDLRTLINAAKSQKSDKSEAPPDLAANLYLCSIDQHRPLPGSLLAQILIRIRCHDGTPTERREFDTTVNTARVALLKAYLNRNLHKEIPVSLDSNYPEPAYQLGRLFSLLEKIQDEANPGINAGIADRFLGSAMGAPSLVFPRLLKLSRHHLGKMQEKGLVMMREKQMDEILGRFNAGGLPRTQTLEQQGVFILGYHHQRAAFFQKKSEPVQATA